MDTDGPTEELVSKRITITEAQAEWLDRTPRINLSGLVREAIEDEGGPPAGEA